MFLAVRVNADPRKGGRYSKFPTKEEYKEIWDSSPMNGFHECVNFKRFKGKCIKGYLPPTGFKKYVPNEPFAVVFVTAKTKTDPKLANKIIGIQLNCTKTPHTMNRNNDEIPSDLRSYLNNKGSNLTYNYTAPHECSILFSKYIDDGSEAIFPKADNGKTWSRPAIKPISEKNIPAILNKIENEISKEDKKQWNHIKKFIEFNSLEQMSEDFDKAVSNLQKEAKFENNPKGNRHPPKVKTTATVYIRDPQIVAAVLKRAKGKCERCHKKTFKRKKDGTPYLEVHHKKMLKDGGADAMENAIALCPNCHRKIHFGR